MDFNLQTLLFSHYFFGIYVASLTLASILGAFTFSVRPVPAPATAD